MGKAAKPVKRRSVLLRLALFAFVIYSITSLIQLQLQLIDKKQELQDLQVQAYEKQTKNEELEQLLATGTQSDFIERAARDKLGYVYEDEEVFTDVHG